MKTLGNDVYIQRGETWSLDFDVTNKNGDPYQMLKEWKNPYLAITVTAARYEQEGDFRKTYWLDLMQRIVEQEDGSTTLSPMKMFTGTEALQLSLFAINEVLAVYGTDAGGRIVLDDNSDFDVKNFLFKVDELHDGNWQYKYVSDYEFGDCAEIKPVEWTEGRQCQEGEISSYNNSLYYVLKATNGQIPGDIATNDEDGDGEDDYFLECSNYVYENGVYRVYRGIPNPTPRGCLFFQGLNVGDSTKINIELTFASFPYVDEAYYEYIENTIISETWEDYSFRVIKQFRTRDWVEQNYLFDIKVLAGETVAEYVYGYLSQDPEIDVPELPWTDEVLQEQINLISDKDIRTYVQEIYDSGMPLMPDYDTKAIILQPTKLIVSANIQGRY